MDQTEPSDDVFRKERRVGKRPIVQRAGHAVLERQGLDGIPEGARFASHQGTRRRVSPLHGQRAENPTKSGVLEAVVHCILSKTCVTVRSIAGRLSSLLASGPLTSRPAAAP